MELHEFYFISLSFLAELLGSVSGVSSSTLFIPLALLLESFQVTLALTASVHVIGNSTRALLYWKSVNWRLVIKFGILSVLFSAIGAQFSSWLSPRIYSFILGLFLMAIACYLFLRRHEKFFSSAPWVPYFGGALSGLLTGLVGSGGAIRSAALFTFGLSPIEFLATSTLIDFGGDLIRLIVYLQKGYFNREHYFYIPILLVSTLSANLLARSFLKKISQEKFKKIVLFFIFCMGVVTILINLFFSVKDKA